MTKYKKQRKVVGKNNFERKAVALPLIELIITHQQKLQDKEDTKRKPKRITWLYASLNYAERKK